MREEDGEMGEGGVREEGEGGWGNERGGIGRREREDGEMREEGEGGVREEGEGGWGNERGGRGRMGK